MRARWLLAATFLLWSSACTHEVLLRTEYDLVHLEQLVATNSVIEPRHIPRKIDKGRVQISYPFLIQNKAANQVYRVLLSQGGVEIGKTPEGTPVFIPAVCRARGEERPRDVELGADQKLRVDCSAEIVTDDKNRLSQRDTQAFFGVPIEKTAGVRLGTLRFKYLLKIEDFE